MMQRCLGKHLCRNILHVTLKKEELQQCKNNENGAEKRLSGNDDPKKGFCPRALTFLRTGPGWNQEPVFYSDFPTWEPSSQTHEPPSAVCLRLLAGRCIRSKANKIWTDSHMGYWSPQHFLIHKSQFYQIFVILPDLEIQHLFNWIALKMCCTGSSLKLSYIASSHSIIGNIKTAWIVTIQTNSDNQPTAFLPPSIS